MNCSYCGEPVGDFEACEGIVIVNGAMHRECLIRSVAGSAAHQLHECSCYGGERHDPPGVSLRESARLAYQAFRTLQGIAQ